jgi:G3E family GTPase
MYQKNFGEFFNNQIAHASCLILSHTTGLAEAKIEDCVQRLRELNATAPIVTTDWNSLDGAQLLSAMNQTETLDSALQNLLEETEHEHHHHEHEHDHEHHHEHGENCTCGCHDHDHDHEHHDHDHEHHHHHADDVFTSWGVETAKAYTAEEILAALQQLDDADTYGMVLRAKGIVAGADGTWIHFDYVPGTPDVRTGSAATTGRLCVIGSHIKEDALAALFRVQ